MIVHRRLSEVSRGRRTRIGRSLIAGMVALFAAADWGCGGDDDTAGEAPTIETLRDESGDGIAVIGEDVTVLGVTGSVVRVSIAGLDALIVSSDGDGVTVRVPPGVPAGEVAVVAENAHGVSEPVPLIVRRLAYTADFADKALTVLDVDGTKVEVVGRVEVDVAPGPFAVRFTPDGRTAVVACGIGFLPESIIAVLAPGSLPGDSVAIVDVIAGETVAVVKTGDESIPTGVAIHPDGQTAYVTNFATSVVSVIDLLDRRLVENIEVPRQPEEMALNPDGSFLLVNSAGGSVSVIDTASLEVVETIETGGNDPSGVAWSADGAVGYVAHSFTDPELDEDGTVVLLDLIDPLSPMVVETVADGIGPTSYDIKLVPGTGMAVVTNLNVIFSPISIGPGSVSIVDFGVVPPAVEVVPVGTSPIRVAVSSDGRVALVGNGLDQSVSVVDLSTRGVALTLDLGSTLGPSDVAIQP